MRKPKNKNKEDPPVGYYQQLTEVLLCMSFQYGRKITSEAFKGWAMGHPLECFLLREWINDYACDVY